LYERSHQPLLTRRAFLRRLVLHVAGATLLLLGSVAIGAAGSMLLEEKSWPDAMLNATTMLSGMGILHPPQTGAGKLFTAAFSLYAGLIFIAAAGIVLAPLVHRLLHSFHSKNASDN